MRRRGFLCVSSGEAELFDLIFDFAKQLGAKINIDERLLVEADGRYFLLSTNLRRLLRPGFFFVGIYLGKYRRGRFFPSFSLLKMVAFGGGRSVVVDERSEWLFVCGRDVFQKGVVEVRGEVSEGDLVLIMNSHDECLGFGRALGSLGQVAVRNISDVGDFLRRERHKQ